MVLFPRNDTMSKVTEQTILVNVAMVWSDPFIRLAEQKNWKNKAVLQTMSL
jgi:hypothetical protein